MNEIARAATVTNAINKAAEAYIRLLNKEHKQPGEHNQCGEYT